MEDRSLQCLGGNKPHLEKLTLGVARILEASPGVTGVSVMEREPADIGMITAWEQENDCVLPEDLKNFYLMTNGFHMLWNVKLDRLVPNGDDPEKPHFDSRNRIFELDSCSGNGKVCLVYKKDKPAPQDAEIWFLDRALYWHFLSDSFTTYYRLLITHLGLPQWQYAFTSYGISPQARQWFNMYKPITYNTAIFAEEECIFLNKLDPSKVFKSKSKTLVSKKRSSLQSSSSQRGSSTSPVIKPSPLPGNPIRK
ncbi:tubulin polyglutamylase complex subunit 2 isoform X3 [Sarcophilus harrisii]|uniref:tubulin polyglutamylase complex subunit 2 isoform X3 n=1 Tax=Sarcophilus harrisii TaxID=9305 RepID=UPI001301AC2C|nr:tubulin polyglutamylase complex subunit 2 isoform X3 [Sarcophilus harrisii]